MGLRPEVSIPVAAGVAGMVLAIHTNATPSVVDVRGSLPGTVPNSDVNRARRQATWLSIGLVSGISLLAKDATILIVGGAMAVGLDWWTRYSNAVWPAAGRILGVDQAEAAAADVMAGDDGTAGVGADPYAGAPADQLVA